MAAGEISRSKSHHAEVEMRFEAGRPVSGSTSMASIKPQHESEAQASAKFKNGEAIGGKKSYLKSVASRENAVMRVKLARISNIIVVIGICVKRHFGGRKPM